MTKCLVIYRAKSGLLTGKGNDRNIDHSSLCAGKKDLVETVLESGPADRIPSKKEAIEERDWPPH